MTEFEHLEDDENYKSKTQIKREMEDLQVLGKKLLSLSKQQQQKVEMSETLRAALTEATRLNQREAMRRHMQYIGRLMRNEDAEAIEARVALFDSSSAAHNKLFHSLEAERDALIGENSSIEVQNYLDENPNIDIQHFRQLVRQSIKELAEGKKTTARKKLFKYIREVKEEKLGINV
ncbi:DUF615 domain-containing protein [Marinomonas sp. 15G1-11]|uniref:Dual-action ribosomal maturation protein DarP n=1 Tax=Marinomonas phaeophyticola TaxID=3004091 RepID=A0ABT4JZR9_9GAMM|nr:ribosome biogenesis factor YjgA [Marinomonas sp. 15G1-11]MCZ2723029.1 DUF615 domain-containing protein [Marinomonas sp. 15G1-11]